MAQNKGPREDKMLNQQGYQYEHGIGVTKDTELAEKFYEKAIALGNTTAMINLATMILNSLESPAFVPNTLGSDAKSKEEKIQKAIGLLKKAGNGGNGNGWLHLGNLYSVNPDFQDFSKARTYYQKGADAGLSLSKNNLGFMELQGFGKEKPDFVSARKLFEEALDQGELLAANNLMVMFDNKLGEKEGMIYEPEIVKKWQKKYFCYYLANALNGDSNSMTKIAKMYMDGYCVPKDQDISNIWLLKAVRSGCPDATNILGEIMLRGEGMEKNPVAAFELFRKSSEVGNVNAMVNMASMYANGIAIEQNYEKAMKFYKKAAKQNHPDAIYNLACIHLNGWGTKKNPEKARDLIKKLKELNIDLGELNLKQFEP